MKGEPTIPIVSPVRCAMEVSVEQRFSGTKVKKFVKVAFANGWPSVVVNAIN